METLSLETRSHRWPKFWLALLLPLSIILASCGSKQTDSASVPPSQTPTDAATPASTASAQAPSDSSGPKVPAMVITYQTLYTPNRYAIPGVQMPATQGQEIRYLDLDNKRMRLEKYTFDKTGKRLYVTYIMDQTGSYRIDPGTNEAFFEEMFIPAPMKTPLSVWTFDDKISKEWAQAVNLSITPGECLGRPCDVIGLASAGKVWLWNDIPLKKEQKTVTTDIVIEASRIQENVPVNASLFQAPAGMKITPLNPK